MLIERVLTKLSSIRRSLSRVVTLKLINFSSVEGFVSREKRSKEVESGRATRLSQAAYSYLAKSEVSGG